MIAILICCIQLGIGLGNAEAAQDDIARYNQIRHSIKANRHLSAHMVMAVDARTIKAVRGMITEQDIPVLVRMMGDKQYGVASAASGLLATLGKKAMPALHEATNSSNSSIASQAQDALMLIENCYKEPQRTNPDVCPSDRPDKNE
ncbi:MAG: hypothetical protein ACXWJK_16075 [Burkholderiaceae bacterium]